MGCLPRQHFVPSLVQATMDEPFLDEFGPRSSRICADFPDPYFSALARGGVKRDDPRHISPAPQNSDVCTKRFYRTDDVARSYS